MRTAERIRIEIDRLVIESPIADREELVRAIRGELERLYAGGGPALAGGQADGRLAISDRSIETVAGAAPREIGHQVARTIWNAAQAGEETR